MSREYLEAFLSVLSCWRRGDRRIATGDVLGTLVDGSLMWQFNGTLGRVAVLGPGNGILG